MAPIGWSLGLTSKEKNKNGFDLWSHIVTYFLYTLLKNSVYIIAQIVLKEFFPDDNNYLYLMDFALNMFQITISITIIRSLIFNFDESHFDDVDKMYTRFMYSHVSLIVCQYLCHLEFCILYDHFNG